jgi:hypothetical protein
MPAKSQAQARLFAAAEHGATFPLAQSIRSEMTKAQLHDFAATPRKGLPAHVKTAGHPARNLGAHLHPKRGK